MRLFIFFKFRQGGDDIHLVQIVVRSNVTQIRFVIAEAEASDVETRNGDGLEAQPFGYELPSRLFIQWVQEV